MIDFVFGGRWMDQWVLRESFPDGIMMDPALGKPQAQIVKLFSSKSSHF